MKVVPNTTDWVAMMQRLQRTVDFAESKKYVAAQVDVADLKAILAGVGPGAS